jgi:hypothetical protein
VPGTLILRGIRAQDFQRPGIYAIHPHRDNEALHSNTEYEFDRQRVRRGGDRMVLDPQVHKSGREAASRPPTLASSGWF